MPAIGFRILGPAAGGGGVDGNASGATLTVNATIVDGAATAAAAASGATLTVNASVVNGAATGGASVAGQTLSVQSSIVDGVATGGASVSGQTLSPTITLLAGTATGDATASGQTLDVDATLVDGVASGDSDVTAPGDTITVTLTLIAGTATGGTQQHSQGAGSVNRRDIKRLKKARRKQVEALERHLRALTGEAEEEAEEATIAGAPPPEAPPLIAEAKAAAVTLADLIKTPAAAEPPISLEYVQDLLTRLEDFIEQQDEEELMLLAA